MIDWRQVPLQNIGRGDLVRVTKRHGLGAGLRKEGVVVKTETYEVEGRVHHKVWARWERASPWISTRHWDAIVGIEVDDPAPPPAPVPVARVEPRQGQSVREFVPDPNKKPKPFQDVDLKDAFV